MTKLEIAVAALTNAQKALSYVGKQDAYIEYDFVQSVKAEVAAALAAIQSQPDAAAGGALNDALMRCCTDLPVGYGIVINVERDAGIVTWIDPDSDEYDIHGEGHLSDDVAEAYDACVAAAIQAQGSDAA